MTRSREARGALHRIFSDVTPRYDLINRVFTLGMDRTWRLRAAREILAHHPRRVLDLACGTGDLAVTIAREADGLVEVTGMDFSERMLDEARRKARTARARLRFIAADAAGLPFPDGTFDCVGTAFAFRNLTYRHASAARHVAEVLRVLRPGGRFVVVESSQPGNRVIREIDHVYLRACVYPLGRWLSGSRRAYSYLATSAARYFTAEELQAWLLGAGFCSVSFRRLFFGAAAVHVAVKGQ